MELRSPTLQADSLPSEPPGTPSFTGSVTLVMLKPGLPLQDWLLRMGAGTSTLARVGPERTWEECSSVCVIGGSSGVERRGDDLTNVWQ